MLLNIRREYIKARLSEYIVLTPKPSDKPKINGAKIYGVRPNSPFLYIIAATGKRSIEFNAENLPAGLSLDKNTGIITGILKEKGEYNVTLKAKNKPGSCSSDFKIVCGDRIALTPPMGWNSWNCFANAVSDKRVRLAADAFVKSGLINHGWSYINIDDFWENNPGSSDSALKGEARDNDGFINTNKRFPDMKALGDYIHSKGLKMGIYSSPGPLTCGGCFASYNYEAKDVQKYNEWGVDYLKYDWCSYSQVAGGNSLPELMKPYQVMRNELNKVSRDIVYSLCQYGMGNVWEWGDQVGGNNWRTTGDITDTWKSMTTIGFNQAGHEKYAKPGNWNDPDMLIVGMVGWGPNLHPTRLTANEQYTHISLWCLLSAPLLIGCDLTQLDDFTFGLLTNDEVINVNQDPLGKQASRISAEGDIEIWAKEMQDGSLAVGLFNRGDSRAEIKADFKSLNLSNNCLVRDLWRQKDEGTFTDNYKALVPAHGVKLVKISQKGN
jgi:alpha-galactosidase